MSNATLTIEPTDVTASDASCTSWLEKLEVFVRQAAASGEVVTLTAQPVLLTPEEMAMRFGVSRSTISRKIKTGDIHAIKVGNRNRIPYAEFERYWTAAASDMSTMIADDIAAEPLADA